MQKLIRILAIAACVLVALSLFLMVLVIPFRFWIAKLYVYPEDIMAVIPLMHWPTVICSLLSLVCTGLMIVCCGNKRGGIWLELLLIGALALALPAVSTGLPLVWTQFVVNFRGDVYVIAYNLSEKIASFCVGPAQLGNCLALVAAGMSIAFKRMSKKLQ